MLKSLHRDLSTFRLHGSSEVKMLFECHAHMFMNGVDYMQAVSDHKKSPDEALVRCHLDQYAKRGISFVREGGDHYGVGSLAKRLAPEYGIDYRFPAFGIYKRGHYGKIVGLGFDDLREYRVLVEKAFEAGADFIKIMTTGVMDFNAYGVVTGDALDADEVEEMVRIPHAFGLSVMAHTNGKRAVLDVLEAGADSVEHANFIDNEVLQAFAETGAVYVPTATVAKNIIGACHGNDDVLSRIWEQSKDNIKKAFELGVVCAPGSDAGAVGVLHGQGTLDEYDCFADAIGSRERAEQWLAVGARRIQEVFRRP